jgi:putative drug exporter of the RND superfamily
MLHIARWTTAHRRFVVLAWIVAAVGVLAVSSSVGQRNANNFTLPGTGSQHAVDLLATRFPAQAGDADQIVFHARLGTLADPNDRAAIETMLVRVARLPHVTRVVSPYAAGQHAMSRDGTIAFATVDFDQRANALPKAAIDKVIATAESARSSHLQVELGGQAIEQAQQASLGFATVVGLAAAILILLLSFGSFTAMGLPILTALFGLGAAMGVISLASHVVDMPNFASELALMIGLGVGIDYALFIVTRFRESYRQNGGDVERATETALNTSGRAVLFAGITVVIALLGMFALGINLLDGAAVAAAIGVILVLTASLTLLPPLLSLMGRRIGEVGARARADDAGRPGFWLRWVRQIQRRPAAVAVAATALMLVLAAPALGLRLASSDAGNDPAGQTTHKAYDLLARGFGPGFNGPLQIAVALPGAHDTRVLGQLTHSLQTTSGIASVATPLVNTTGTAAAIVAYPTSSPQSAQTSNLVTQLRDTVIPPIEQATGATVYVGGATASQVDFSHILASKLPLFVAVVIALAALLLVVVFRSLVIPVQAAVMNLLSIGASLGIAQAVFERGWLSGLLGVQPGPIDAFIPVLAFAIIFGLSMDYEVFLVSRVHEEWTVRRDASAAVREGLARTGRVITAAAAVMVAVFGAFMISGNRVLALFGLVMAGAVFLDAIVIRMLLLPAVLELLGRRTWVLPGWVGRRLPRVALEAEPSSRPAPTPEPALEASS